MIWNPEVPWTVRQDGLLQAFIPKIELSDEITKPPMEIISVGGF